MKIEVGKYYLTRDGRKVKCVEYDGNDHDRYPYFFDDGEWRTSSGMDRLSGDESKQDLIAEWTDTHTGPVITETVTTKRIVSGVFGPVTVDAPNGDGEVYISIQDRLSRADLIAARDVFNQLIDAMEGQK